VNIEESRFHGYISNSSFTPYSYLERPFEGTEEESEKVDEGCTRTTQSGQDEEEQRKTRAQ